MAGKPLKFSKDRGAILNRALETDDGRISAGKGFIVSNILKSGDVVYLKSGGPKMTVETIDDGWVTCIWFDGYTVLKHSLMLVTIMRF